MIKQCELCDQIKPVTYFEHINKYLCKDREVLPTRLEGSE